MERLREHHSRRGTGWRILDLAARWRDRLAATGRSPVDVVKLRREIAHIWRITPLQAVAFAPVATPRVSVVIPALDDVQLTRRCLAALSLAAPTDLIEVIVPAVASPGHDIQELVGIDGVRVVAVEHMGFAAAASAGAEAARGEFVFFLNNDSLVLPGCIEALVGAFEDPTIGAAGAQVLHRSGRLLEAGRVVWRDGTSWSLGEGRNPFGPGYSYRREVDYCSAAALMVRTQMGAKLGYLGREFAPAAYADADLCFSVAARGLRIVCEPAAAVVRGANMIRRRGVDVASVSSGSYSMINEEANRGRFVEKWSRRLTTHPDPPRDRRTANFTGNRGATLPSVLVCDVILPTPDRDSGSHRMDWMLRLLMPITSRLTIIPLKSYAYPEYARPLLEAGVEVVAGEAMSLRRFLKSRSGMYDIVVLSRPDVGERWLKQIKRKQPNAVIIFDTVDLHSLRFERELKVLGRSPVGDPARTRELEARLIGETDFTTVVSPDEEQLVRKMEPGARVVVLPNVHDMRDTDPPGFEGRRGLLFIGNFDHTPNIDGVAWFAREVLPLIRNELDVDLVVVGQNAPEALQDECGPHVLFTGWVPSVEPLFDTARVFVTPLRFGAGVKGKVGQSLSLGLPVVSTTVGAEGMGLVDGTHALVRDGVADFARAVIELHENRRLWRALSQAGLDVVSERWTPAMMRRRLEVLLTEAVGYPHVDRWRTGGDEATRVAG